MATSQEYHTLKEKQRKEREALILRIAEEVFLEKGFHETSMEEIAARVGIAKGTVYLHFASKEDLIIAIFKQDARVLTRKLDEILPLPITPKEKLEKVIDMTYANYFGKRARLLYTLYYGVDIRKFFLDNPEICQFKDTLNLKISHILDEGKQRGEFEKTVPTEVMINSLFCLLSPRNYEQIIKGNTNIEEMGRYAKYLFFHGVNALQPNTERS